MKFVESLASYLPSLIVAYLLDPEEKDPTRKEQRPARQSYDTVCLFADVSGFTALSEAMSKDGPEGAEYVAKHLNSYFSMMVRTIASEGGDVFKFAGDAMIVLWPKNDDIETRTRRAAQCALRIQLELHRAELAEGVELSVKVGIGVGPVSVLHMGGMLNRLEYVAVGEPLVQAFNAEGDATPGDVILSPPAWKLVNEFFENGRENPSGSVCLDSKGRYRKLKTVSKLNMLSGDLYLDDFAIESKLRSYVPGAILGMLSRDGPDQETWGSELRRLSCLFVNLGLKDHDLLAAAQYDDAMHRCHDVLVAVQRAVYNYEGSVNKFLMDDKGSTLIAVFGLPPLTHENDCSRAILCALAICSSLEDLKLTASVGITTGVAFCGVVGSTTRKEYSVLGDTVNLSARLMSHACKHGGGVYCDSATRKGAGGTLQFQELSHIKVKGKSNLVATCRPYPAQETGQPKQGIKGVYKSQLEYYRHYNLLNPHQVVSRRVKEAEEQRQQQQQQEAEARAADGGAAAAHGAPPGMGSKLKRRGSVAMLFKPRRRPSTLMGSLDAQLREATVVPEITSVSIKVPRKFKQSGYFASSQLKAVSGKVGLAGVATTGDLRAKLLDMAKGEDLVKEDADPNDFLLGIRGTDHFLPEASHDIRWLKTFVQESPVTQHTFPSEGTLDTLLVRRQDRHIVQPRHSFAWQQLLCAKVKLVDSGEGSVTLLEGEMGAGKTTLLARARAVPTPEPVKVYCSSGDPFNRFTPYNAFAPLLREYIVAARGDLTGEEFVLQVLREQGPMLVPYASVANERLALHLEAAEDEGKLSVEDQRNLLHAILLALILHMVAEQATMLVVDDGFYMDAASWSMALDLATGGATLRESMPFEPVKQFVTSGVLAPNEPIKAMLLFATRPYHHFVDTIVMRPPLAFDGLCKVPHVNFLKLGRLPIAEVRELVKVSVGSKVSKVSPRLFELAEERSRGNPLILKEFMCSMCDADTPNGPLLKYKELEDGTQLCDWDDHTFDPTLTKPSGGMTGAPFPLRFYTMLGMRIDRLTACQMMILKVGSVAGLSFTFSLLYEAFPLEHLKSNLVQELGELEEKDFLHKVTQRGGGDEAVFAFNLPFVRDAIQRRMLNEQKQKLERVVKAVESRIGGGARQLMFASMTSGSNSIPKLSSSCFVRKNISSGKESSRRLFTSIRGEWKRRVIKLDADRLLINKAGGDVPVQVIQLDRATVKEVREADIGKRNCFKVEVSSWVKKGETKREARSFFIAMETEQDLKQWVKWASLAAEFIQHRKQASHRPSMATPSARLALRQATADAGGSMAGAAREQQDRLVLVVEEARNLKVADMCGTSDPYCVLTLGTAKHRTTVCYRDLNPVWGEEFTFSVLPEEAAEASVKLELWDKDNYGSDDFLGQCSLPLSSLRMHPSTTTPAASPPSGSADANDDDDTSSAGGSSSVAPPSPANGEQTAAAEGEGTGSSAAEATVPTSASARGRGPSEASTGTPALSRRKSVLKEGDDLADTLWLTLRPRVPNETVTGELCLSVRLQLSPDSLLLAQEQRERREAAEGDAGSAPAEARAAAEGREVSGPGTASIAAGGDEYGATPVEVDDEVDAPSRSCPAPSPQQGEWEQGAGNGSLSPTAPALPGAEESMEPPLSAAPSTSDARRQRRLASAAVRVRRLLAMAHSGERVTSQDLTSVLRLMEHGGAARRRESQRSGASEDEEAEELATDSDSDSEDEWEGEEAGPEGGLSSKRSFYSMVSMVDLDDTSRRWLAEEYSRDGGQGEEGEEGDGASVGSPSGARHAHGSSHGALPVSIEEEEEDEDEDEEEEEEEGGGGGGAEEAVSGNGQASAESRNGADKGAAATKAVTRARARSEAEMSLIAKAVEEGVVDGTAEEPVDPVWLVKLAAAIGLELATGHGDGGGKAEGGGAAAAADGDEEEEGEEGAGDAYLGREDVVDAVRKAVDSGRDLQFYYIDLRGQTQGPHPRKHMKAWNKAGYFKPDLKVCVAGATAFGHLPWLLPLIAGEEPAMEVVEAAQARTAKREAGPSDDGSAGSGDSQSKLPCSLDSLPAPVKAWRTVVPVETAAQDPSRDMTRWDFNTWHFSEEEITHMAAALFELSGLMDTFHVPRTNLYAFMEKVHRAMTRRRVPYHNYRHVVDVLQTVYVFAYTLSGARLLTELETFGLLVASIAHDLEHPGLNNAYQMNANTPLAVRYSDDSVLERHHCAVAFVSLRKPHTSLFLGLDRTQYREIRRVIISSILATDMTCHFGLTEELKACVMRIKSVRQEQGVQPPPGAGAAPDGPALHTMAPHIAKSDREIVVKTMLHAADISNPCKPWELSKTWSDRLLEEFFQQGDQEKKEGLPVSPNMDRNTTSQGQLSLNFTDFIVAPLMVALTNLVPGNALACEHMSANRARWQSMVDADLEKDTSMSAEDREKEHDKWRRRAKAFEDVVMPIAKALGGASTPLQGEELERRSAAQSKRMRRKSLNTLRTFVRMSSPVAAGGTQSAPLEEQPP